MEFLTPGEKLRKIRKELNMTQSDFADESMTRSYVGMIEVGKRNLNPSIARIILEKLNARAKELNVEISIDEDYLTMSREEEAERYCKNIMDNNPTEEQVNSVIEISLKYGLKETGASAYRVMGDMKYEEYHYLDAFLAYNNSLDICKTIGKLDIQCYLINRLGMCKYDELDYVEALLYFTRAQQYAVELNNYDIEVKAIFNIALTYKKMKKLEEAKKYVEIYINKINGSNDYEEMYAKGNILKSNCIKAQGNIEEAIVILKETVSNFKGITKYTEGMIYNNLGGLYLDKGDYDNSLSAFNKSESIRIEYDESSLAHTIIHKAELYIEKELYTEAILLLKMGCDIAQKYNDNFYLILGYKLLIEIYQKLNKIDKAEELYYKIIDLADEKYNSLELLNAYLKLVELYIKQNKLEEAANIIKLSQKISGNW
ncbi:tetratricopeptide (TPR) repeat protein [Clostridium punense]|uniref:Tetratricopeptide (TPR) repeat protein n=1 Tax=Clostridium punense TaxID=1054297 RepID=A0ABS4K2R0_9CLOT|nr:MULTISPECIES: helix-turn-helix domain-containing protein [Clostridium]EQB87637.1 hypothetical protein M918_08060 [Clostridium sp. BL8]MBP2022073.1 tetratricopeptide (TPR) repeat protein [Clostridium punense]